MSEKKIHFDHF